MSDAPKPLTKPPYRNPGPAPSTLPPIRYPENPSPSARIGRWIMGLVQRLRGG